MCHENRSNKEAQAHYVVRRPPLCAMRIDLSNRLQRHKQSVDIAAVWHTSYTAKPTLLMTVHCP